MKQQPTRAALALLALGAAACGPRMQAPRPIVPNGGTVPSGVEATIARASAEGRAAQAQAVEERDHTEAVALAACSPAICDALARGELAVGMTEAQVLTATRSGQAAWSARGSGRVRTLAAAQPGSEPHDVVGPVAYVTLDGGRVRSIAYREPQGVRLVASAADAAPAGVARARAQALLREGDELALAGRFPDALDRYDRADVIRPDDPETTLRIAQALDKLLRPQEAALRYRLFLHQLELEKIQAQGDAYAHLASAVVAARERIVVLERGR